MKKLSLSLLMVIILTFSLCTLNPARAGQASANATASQGQAQNQSQGQSQATNSNVTHSGNSAVQFHDSFNGAAPIRDLPVPSFVEVSTRGGNAYFARPDADTGAAFISMRNLIYILNLVDEAVLEFDADDLETKWQPLNAGNAADDVTAVKFSLVGKGGVYPPNFKPVALVSVAAQEEVNSATVAAALTAKAMELGCSNVVFIKEGVQHRLDSSGWGVGLSYNYATVGSGASGHGGVGAGGTGYSQASARYFSLPYLTAICGN